MDVAPKPAVVVDLLSSDSEEDGTQGEQAGVAARKVPTAVVLERVREAEERAEGRAAVPSRAPGR